MRPQALLYVAFFAQLTSFAPVASAYSSVTINGVTTTCEGSMINGLCYPACDGVSQITDSHATCNGVEMKPLNGEAAAPKNNMDICGPGANVAVHANGGGLVEATAQVSEDAKIETGSAVCGTAVVDGPVSLAGLSKVSGAARVSGKTSLISSQVSGQASVTDSGLTSAHASGSSIIVKSKLMSSDVSGHAQVHGSSLMSSEVSGEGDVQGSSLMSSDVSGSARVSGESLMSQDRS